MIPFLDIKAVNDRYRDELVDAATRVIDSGWYILGAEVRAFEDEFASWCDAPHAIGVSNGLAALRIVLEAWLEQGKLQKGDGVIVPANTFIASLLAITAAGLDPILVEPDESTFNLSVEGVKNVMSPSVKAVMAVHLYGRIAPMEGLAAYCAENGLLLLEDSAQAHGVKINGQAAGTWGDAACFSFYPGKNLGALGDGGAVTCKDDELAAIVRAIANYGAHKKYEHIYRGSNERLDEIQAAMLRVKLKHMDADNARRQEIAARYAREISNPGVTLPQMPQDPAEHVWHLYVVRVQDREKYLGSMDSQGIQCLIHYPIPLHHQGAYSAHFKGLELPLSEKLHGQVVSMPISPVMSEDEVTSVINAVNAYTV